MNYSHFPGCHVIPVNKSKFLVIPLRTWKFIPLKNYLSGSFVDIKIVHGLNTKCKVAGKTKRRSHILIFPLLPVIHPDQFLKGKEISYATKNNEPCPRYSPIALIINMLSLGNCKCMNKLQFKIHSFLKKLTRRYMIYQKDIYSRMILKIIICLKYTLIACLLYMDMIQDQQHLVLT